MFSLFKKDPLKKLRHEYTSVLETAMAAQRKGDIRLYSELTEKSEKILNKINEIEEKSNT